MDLRLTATTILVNVIKNGQSLTSALDDTFKATENSKDKAFVQALCYGVLRQYHKLEYILQQLMSKPLRNKDTDIKVLILLGLYQLQSMRVKTHAAVSETVGAVKKKNWAKGLINGVLRQYIRNQESLEKLADQNIPALHSHPQWLIDVIQKDWPEQATVILQENNKPPPMALRVNLAKSNREKYLTKLAEQSIPAIPVSFCSSAIILEQAVVVEKLPDFNAGVVSIQDTAAQLAAQLLDAQPEHSVLDLCAAPGGKTAAILELQPKLGSMLAIDIDESRLNRVKENLHRLNLKATLRTGDATTPEKWAEDELFDRILVDAPCSALGVIRRHPDIKLLKRESDILNLQSLQKLILEKAWELLSPQGVLLYATCSILKQENEQQVEHFLSTHPDAQEIPIDANWGLARKMGRQILTGESNMDGFYYAKLLKL